MIRTHRIYIHQGRELLMSHECVWFENIVSIYIEVRSRSCRMSLYGLNTSYLYTWRSRVARVPWVCMVLTHRICIYIEVESRSCRLKPYTLMRHERLSTSIWIDTMCSNHTQTRDTSDSRPRCIQIGCVQTIHTHATWAHVAWLCMVWTHHICIHGGRESLVSHEFVWFEHIVFI